MFHIQKKRRESLKNLNFLQVIWGKYFSEIIDPRTASQPAFHAWYSLENICFRDIVSDADKLDAIGYAGIERCRDFSKYRAPNASCEEIEENVVEHMHDKLLKLLDQYIRTDSAKTIGQPLQKEMLDYLENK